MTERQLSEPNNAVEHYGVPLRGPPRFTAADEPGDGDEFIEETAPTNDKERMVDRLLGRNKSKKIAAG